MHKRILVVSVFLIALGLACDPASAEASREKTERQLTVQGQAKVPAVPDIATLTVEVSAEGAELDPILVQVRKQMGKIMETVKSQGIEDKDVRTDMFQVHPKTERDKRGNPQRAGFVAANRITVKVRDLKKTGKVLAAVLNAGATSVVGPNFEIDNPDVVERQALAAATKDARAKAQAVAEAANVQLGDIMAINPQNVNWPGPPRPMMMRKMAMAATMEAEEPIAAGEQTVVGYVSVTYAIR